VTNKAFLVRDGLRSGSTLVINSAGSWVGNTITEVFGGTGQTTYAIGDILFASAPNTLSKLPKGAAGDVLTMGSPLLPSWQTAIGGGSPVPSHTHDNIADADLLDKTDDETITKTYKFTKNAAGLLNPINLESSGPGIFWLETDESADHGGWKQFCSSADWKLYTTTDLGVATTLAMEFVRGATTALTEVNFPSCPVTSQGNHLLEGYSGQRNIIHSDRIRVQPGATPGTNININAFSSHTAAFNPVDTTDATNLAAGGTSGSWSLSADGKTITQNNSIGTIGPMIASIGIHNINNSSTTEMYTAVAGSASSRLTLIIFKRGSNNTVDWRTIFAAGDLMDVFVIYVTNQ